MTLENISCQKSFGGWHKRYKHRSDVLGCDMTFAEAFRKSDEALYHAKAQGRNRWVLAGSCCLTSAPADKKCAKFLS